MIVHRTHLCARLMVHPEYHVSFLSCSSDVTVLFSTLCLNLYSETSNIVVMFQPHAGQLVDSIDVFDFAPGVHTATITVTDTLGSSASQSFDFTTPEALGRCNGTMDITACSTVALLHILHYLPKYTHHNECTCCEHVLYTFCSV